MMLHDIVSYIMSSMICLLKVKFVNAAIDSAVPGSPLYGLEHIEDPSNKIIEVHIAALFLTVFKRLLTLPCSFACAGGVLQVPWTTTTFHCSPRRLSGEEFIRLCEQHMPRVLEAYQPPSSADPSRAPPVISSAAYQSGKDGSSLPVFTSTATAAGACRRFVAAWSTTSRN